MKPSVMLWSALAALVPVGAGASVAEEKDAHPVETIAIQTESGDIRMGPSGVLATLEKRLRGRGKPLGAQELRKVPLKIKVTTDMGRVNLDLLGLNVRELELRSQSGNVTITLPAAGMITGHLETDMGDFTIFAPPSRTIQIAESKTDMGKIEVSKSLSQSIDGENPARFTLVSQSGDIRFLAVGEEE